MTVKLMICGRRRPGQTLCEHRTHMKDVHGRLVLDYIASEPESAPRRYVQNHGFDGIFDAGDPAATPFALCFDFVSEIWFPDLASATASRETPYYVQRLMPDELNMVDSARVLSQPYAESRIKAPPAERELIKLFVTAAKGAALPREAFDSLPEALGRCRNEAMVPGPIEVIEEFWFADEGPARDFAAACRASLPPFAEGATAMILAHELVLYPGAGRG